MRRSMLWVIALAFTLTGTARVAQAAEPLNVSVDGDVYTADLELPGGASAQLTVTFEDVVGLGPEGLGVSAVAVDPLDPALLQRLGPAASGVPAALPMLVRIEPDPASGLSFSGKVTVELYTHALEFAPASPFRLFSAPVGGAFRDVTAYNLGGSYRSGGTKGNFSEFIIAIDSRTAAAAAAEKLQYLRQLLDSHAAELDPLAYNELSGLLGAAETAYLSGSIVSALTRIEEFEAAVAGYGSTIPNVWSAAGGLENVAGQLRAAADTLRFTLTLIANTS